MNETTNRDRRGDCAPGFAFVFPGQGTLQLGMGYDFYRAFSVVRAIVDAASARSGLPLAELISGGPAERLWAADASQIAVVALSIGLVRQLDAAGVHPASVAGHSAGEFSALAAAGVIEDDVAIDVVVARGRAMAESAHRHDGAMAAITGLPLRTVEMLCGSECAGRVVVAGHNSDVQIIVSGERDDLEKILAAARRARALRTDMLRVRGAFHSPLVADAGRALESHLRDVPMRAPRCALVSSVTGAEVTDIELYRGQLATQMTSPVRWTDVMHTLVRRGTRQVIEVGASKVLGALARRHDPSLEVVSLHDVRAFSQFLAARRDRAMAGAASW